MSDTKQPVTLDEAVASIEGGACEEVSLRRRVDLVEAYLGGTVRNELSDVEFLRKEYQACENDLDGMKERVDLFEKRLASYELKQNYMFSLIDGSRDDESKRHWDILRLAERVERLEARLIELGFMKRREEK